MPQPSDTGDKRTTSAIDASEIPLDGLQNLGEYAVAGQQAVLAALRAAQDSLAEHRIPIAAAAVHQDAQGQTQVVCTGANNRIRGADSDQPGYPTDHGETATIRKMGSLTEYDWSNIVFATTLSPCAMCARTLASLTGLGLNKVVIADSTSFAGRKDLLVANGSIRIAELSIPRAVAMMTSFSSRYPWDWAADIGEIPPEKTPAMNSMRYSAVLSDLESQNRQSGCHVAAVVDANGKVIATGSDQRDSVAGNPTAEAIIRAIGKAGSSVNLRECAMVFCVTDPTQRVSIQEFGAASLGACEVFRPREIVCSREVDQALASLLRSSGITVRSL